MRSTKNEAAAIVASATGADAEATFNLIKNLRDRGVFRLQHSPRGDVFSPVDIMVAAILVDARASNLVGDDMRDLANTLYQGRRATFATGEQLEINVADLLPRILAGEQWAIETSFHRQSDGTVESSSHWVRLTAEGHPDRLGADYPVIAATVRPVSDLLRRVSGALDGAAWTG